MTKLNIPEAVERAQQTLRDHRPQIHATDTSCAQCTSYVWPCPDGKAAQDVLDLAALVERLTAELQNIAEAKPRGWDVGDHPDTEFRQWAQNRARSMLAEARAALKGGK